MHDTDTPRSGSERRAWLVESALAVWSGGIGLAVPGSAGAAAASAPPELAATRDFRAWLMRIHQAASHRNFSGTFVVSAGGNVSSARIAHYVEGGHQYERSETLDGETRRVYRHDESVVTAWPAHRLVTIEHQDLIAQFPALLQAGDDRIGDRYRLEPQGSDRVAGRDAEVVVVQPRDALRYGYRLWADRASGLLLRLDTLGEHHEVLESSSFSDVAIDIKPDPLSVLQPMTKLGGWQVVRPAMIATRLEAEGWRLRQPVPGFREVSCVRRPMPSMTADAPAASTPAASLANAEEGRVVQAIYSDGLTYVSVFIEPIDLGRPRTPILTVVGATQTLMQPQGDAWTTFIGDVPPATLRLFAQGLERRR